MFGGKMHKHSSAVTLRVSTLSSLVAERCFKSFCFQMTLLLIHKVSFLFLAPRRERLVKFAPPYHLQMGNITERCLMSSKHVFFFFNSSRSILKVKVHGKSRCPKSNAHLNIPLTKIFSSSLEPECWSHVC